MRQILTLEQLDFFAGDILQLLHCCKIGKSSHFLHGGHVSLMISVRMLFKSRVVF